MNPAKATEKKPHLSNVKRGLGSKGRKSTRPAAEKRKKGGLVILPGALQGERRIFNAY